jgi:hypothetical protein
MTGDPSGFIILIWIIEGAIAVGLIAVFLVSLLRRKSADFWNAAFAAIAFILAFSACLLVPLEGHLLRIGWVTWQDRCEHPFRLSAAAGFLFALIVDLFRDLFRSRRVPTS